MRKTCGAIAAAIVATVLLAVASAGAQQSASASERIDALHAQLIEVMKQAEVLGYEGRAERLGRVIPDYFDTEFMARISLGSHWKTASDAERQRFLEAFRRFMIANYAGRFDGFSGQRFETLGEEPARRDTLLVRSVLRNPEDDDVELNYRMRKTDGEWKIIDVYLDGTVSEVALRRSEFSGIVRREDFDALLAAIDERIDELASGTES